MKELVSEQQFLLRQPCFPKKTPTDKYYFRLTNRLADILRRDDILQNFDESVIVKVLLGAVGYFQDILTDSGVFRSFTEQHKALYGKWLPFYDTSQATDYIPHELNQQDIRFLIWYTIALNSDGALRLLNPLDNEIEKAAMAIHRELNRLYDDPETPVPEDYHISRGLELGNPEEADEVFHFGNWLFMHCYLMTPAFAMTLSEMLSSPRLKEGKDMEALKEMLEKSMMEDPTGPLALYLREWIFLIIKGKMPPEIPQPEATDASREHPLYTKVVKATDGRQIAFFATYAELNQFFIDALGWEGDDLPGFRNDRDFVILVNKEKGMLIARNVAACLKFPDNPCYNALYAKDHAIDLLTMRGLCPADLLHYAFRHNALPDARFPGSEDFELVASNRDFIARCYLQKYYRGD